MPTPNARDAWLHDFRRETAPHIDEPFLLCLAEAVAAVESAWGRAAIRPARTSPPGVWLNEIGYKAIPGHPATERTTREIDAEGLPQIVRARFRLFRDRAEQARALLYLMRSSRFFETARLLYILAFCAAYAPGNTAGAESVVRVFNQLAARGTHPGVRPLALIGHDGDRNARALNHTAARRAVRLFAGLTRADACQD